MPPLGSALLAGPTPRILALVPGHRNFTQLLARRACPVHDPMMDAVHFAEFVMPKERKDRIGSTEAVVYPKPFIWTVHASNILEEVTRARKRLNQSQSV